MSTDDKTLVPLQVDVLGINNDEVGKLIRSLRVQDDGFVVAADLVKAVDENFVINHCFYGALQALMKQQQIELEETDIYFLCNGPSITYEGGKQYETFGLYPMIHMMKEWGQHTGIDISYTHVDPQTHDKAAIVQDWYDVLSAGKTLLLHVDTGNLIYNELFSASPGGGHIVQLYGMQPSENIAHIVDHFLLDKAGKVLGYNGTIPLSELLEGIVEYGGIESKIVMEVEPEKVLAAAVDHLEDFLNGGITSEGYAKGIAAYGMLNTEMATLSELDDAEFEKACGVLYYQLRVESLMHLLRYTIQLVERYEYLIGDDASVLIRDFQQLQDQGQRQMMTLYKMGMRRDRSKLAAWVTSNNELLKQLSLHLERLVSASKSVSIS